MQFSDIYGTQLDVELGSADRTTLFTTVRRKKAVNDAMHNFERITFCTPVYGSISVTNSGSSATVTGSGSSGGTGYSVNDILTLVGGTFTTAAQFKVTAVSGGVITTLALQTAGLYTVLPSNPVAVTGGTGSNATLNVVFIGTAEYDVLANFSNFISTDERQNAYIKRVTSSGQVIYIQGDDLLFSSPAWLDRDESNWRADPSSTPQRWYYRDDSGTTFIGLDPSPLIPVGETWTLYLPYLASSVDMVGDTDKPFTIGTTPFLRLAPYHQGLVHYAAGLLEALRKNYDAQKYQMSLYSGYVQQYLGHERRVGPDQVTFARKYYQEHGRPNRNMDPHRFP